jgi:hypothetical protein
VIAAPLSLDAEVIELLRDSPELLAIADAIEATQKNHHSSGVRHERAIRLAVVAAVVACGTTLALVAPWSGRGSGFATRALSALGAGEVIHVVTVEPFRGLEVVDVATGKSRPAEETTEIWFDGERGLRRTVRRVNDRVMLEELETPTGAWTEEGRVYTCAWIAGHPVEASRARVSCNLNGDNGTTPRRVPEPRPSLEPALAGFITGYRDALANGEAVAGGEGVVGGRRVRWLTFHQERGVKADAAVERVAVDLETLKPILVQLFVDGRKQSEQRIAAAGTLARDDVAFSRPRPRREALPVGSRTAGSRVVAPRVAARALGGQFVTAGASVGGLRLAQITLRQIVSGYGRSSARPPLRSRGVEVVYGSSLDVYELMRSPKPYVVLKESVRPEMLYRFTGARQVPAGAAMLVTRVIGTVSSRDAPPVTKTAWLGHLRHAGIYIAIEASSRRLLLQAARALTTREVK